MATLEDDEDEEIFAYDYGDDFPTALEDLSKTLLNGRPSNKTLGPLQQIKIFAAAAEYRAPTARRAGKGKILPYSEFEKEMEQDSRKAAQKATQRLIVPKQKVESSDAFIRRLDAHRNAQEAIIIPMTPPEDETLFTKRMVAVKNNETPNMIILPKTARESVNEFEERMATAKDSPCPLIFQRGAHESGGQFKARMTAQKKCKRPIIPKSAEEPDKHFVERCKMQVACTKVVHPMDSKREDEHLYVRRLQAHKERTALAFEPGDKAAIDDAIGVEKEKKEDPYKLPSGKEEEQTAAELMEKAKLETDAEQAKIKEAEEAEAKKLEEALNEKKEAEDEAARVAQRVADMKAKLAEQKALEEEEAQRKKSFAAEQININAIGFMPLKKLLMERGVPKDVVFGAPSKFALQEVARKWGDELKIEWTTE